MYPPRCISGQHLRSALHLFSQPLDQAELQSDVPTSRGTWWPRLVLSWVWLTCTQMYPPLQAAQVSLTFGQPLGQPNLQVKCTPLEASHGQEGTNLDPVHLSSDGPPSRGISWSRVELTWV